MKKALFIISITLFLLNFGYASNQSVNINGIDFKIPEKYQGGKTDDNGYYFENIFSIRCIDDEIGNSIGLWDSEADYKNDLNIKKHPVRHYIQYNKYVNGNHSHLYFASGNSVYEISWVSENITSDIKQLIENTPESNIDDKNFYITLDNEIKEYKNEKINKLNQENEYFKNPEVSSDDSRIKEILLSYYSNS